VLREATVPEVLLAPFSVALPERVETEQAGRELVEQLRAMRIEGRVGRHILQPGLNHGVLGRIQAHLGPRQDIGPRCSEKNRKRRNTCVGPVQRQQVMPSESSICSSMRCVGSLTSTVAASTHTSMPSASTKAATLALPTTASRYAICVALGLHSDGERRVRRRRVASELRTRSRQPEGVAAQ
jgi:hypothetical protein